MINVSQFINDQITGRRNSFFQKDIEENEETLFKEVRGKSVLVIGGAGTIGSSFIKAILTYLPSRLFVVDISENGLTELTRDLRSTHEAIIPKTFKTYPINFNDPIFSRLFEMEGPFDIVANFAAHKHVRSEKDHYSIAALLENNIIHAERLLKLLAQSPPQHFFCVSTDKAANPVNIMGASKSIMEKVIMAYADIIPVKTARFANVAFSNGSLLDGFLHRLMKKQPFSAPSDIKRYFVSPAESGEICLMACILGNSGDIFFPKLEQSQMLTFSEISIKLLKYIGLKPIICNTEEEAKKLSSLISNENDPYPVYFFTSDTSGEKPYEEFFTPGEMVDMTSFNSLGVIKNTSTDSKETISNMIQDLTSVLENHNVTKQAIVNSLSKFLPNFKHIETGKSLDQKM